MQRNGTKVHIFLDMYKQLEDELEDKYRHARRKCSSVVFEFTKDPESAPIRDKLNVCRELRNLLTHNANLGGIPVAEPSGPLVDAMREILDFERKPPLALEFATRGEQVMKASTQQKVLRVMDIMDKNGFSHIPVMNNGAFLGVFSSGVIMRYMLRSHAQHDQIKYLRISKFFGFFCCIYGINLIILFQSFYNMFRILCRSDHHRHRVNPPVIDYQRPVFLKEMGVPQSFQSLKGNDNIRMPFFHDWLRHRFPITDKCNNASASLRHSVNLRKLHVVPA